MIINIKNEKDLKFFDEVIKEYPEDTLLIRERGIDATVLAQIIVDVSVAIAPHFLTALGLFLTYKIEQRKINLQEQELDLGKKQLQVQSEELEIQKREIQKKETDSIQKQDQTEKFEITINSGSHKVVYSNEDLDEDNVNIDEIIKSIITTFETSKKDE